MLKTVLLAVLCVGLCSCASVSVLNVVETSSAPPAFKPQKIYIHPFEFDEGNVRVDREGGKLAEFQNTLQQEMTKNLALRLTKYIAPAESWSDSSGFSPGQNWLVTGRFTRVNQGSRFLRSAFGFGSGGTKMDVSVTILELTESGPRQLVMIRTTGGSNAMPGAIMGVISWPMIIQGGGGIMAGVTSDCLRTSREITSALAAYLQKRGFEVAQDTPKPKAIGRIAWLPQKKSEE